MRELNSFFEGKVITVTTKKIYVTPYKWLFNYGNYLKRRVRILEEHTNFFLCEIFLPERAFNFDSLLPIEPYKVTIDKQDIYNRIIEVDDDYLKEYIDKYYFKVGTEELDDENKINKHNEIDGIEDIVNELCTD